MANFTDVFDDVTKEGHKISKESYLPEGLYPIIDQGQEYIAGYANDASGLYYNVPAIIFGDHTRIIKYIDTPCFLGADGVKLLRAKNPDANYKYLYYALCNAQIPDTGYNRHFKWLKEVDIPLPGASKQEHIVSVLDKINGMIDLRKRQLDKLDELVKARFVEMFENIAESANSVLLDSICEMVTVGIANSATHAYTEDGIIMFRNQNIKDNYLDDSDLIYIHPKFADKYKTKALKENDILVTRTGYPGVACIVPKKYEGCQTFTTLIVRLNEESPINANYVCHYINSSYGKRYVDETKVGVAQQNFGAKVLAKMPIFLPPSKQQQEFHFFTEQVSECKLTIQRGLDKLETMKKALMQQFFG